MMRFFSLTLLLWGSSLTGYGWNMQGHQMVAQIAYDNLNQKAKRMSHKYLRSWSNPNFIKSATWMDVIRYQQVSWFDPFHYICTPFTQDGTALPPVEKVNVVWAINNAISILNSKARIPEKTFAFKVLLHVVGDIHQPLHAATKISAQLPHGDAGGNFFPVGSNDVGDNLHRYWDKGAGFLLGQNKFSKVKYKAQKLEQKWPCSSLDTRTKPEEWAKESFSLALNQVYQLSPKDIPSKQYQSNAQSLTQKQLVVAGCRLAAVLNHLAEK